MEIVEIVGVSRLQIICNFFLQGFAFGEELFSHSVVYAIPTHLGVILPFANNPITLAKNKTLKEKIVDHLSSKHSLLLLKTEAFSVTTIILSVQFL